MQVIPVIVEFRQPTKLYRILPEINPKKQVLLFLKIFAVNIADQLIHVGILLLQEIRWFITVNMMALSHFPKGFLIIFRDFSENNLFPFQTADLIKQFLHAATPPIFIHARQIR